MCTALLAFGKEKYDDVRKREGGGRERNRGRGREEEVERNRGRGREEVESGIEGDGGRR